MSQQLLQQMLMMMMSGAGNSGNGGGGTVPDPTEFPEITWNQYGSWWSAENTFVDTAQTTESVYYDDDPVNGVVGSIRMDGDATDIFVQYEQGTTAQKPRRFFDSDVAHPYIDFELFAATNLPLEPTTEGMLTFVNPDLTDSCYVVYFDGTRSSQDNEIFATGDQWSIRNQNTTTSQIRVDNLTWGPIQSIPDGYHVIYMRRSASIVNGQSIMWVDGQQVSNVSTFFPAIQHGEVPMQLTNVAGSTADARIYAGMLSHSGALSDWERLSVQYSMAERVKVNVFRPLPKAINDLFMNNEGGDAWDFTRLANQNIHEDLAGTDLTDGFGDRAANIEGMKRNSQTNWVLSNTALASTPFWFNGIHGNSSNATNLGIINQVSRQEYGNGIYLASISSWTIRTGSQRFYLGSWNSTTNSVNDYAEVYPESSSLWRFRFGNQSTTVASPPVGILFLEMRSDDGLTGKLYFNDDEVASLTTTSPATREWGNVSCQPRGDQCIYGAIAREGNLDSDQRDALKAHMYTLLDGDLAPLQKYFVDGRAGDFWDFTNTTYMWQSSSRVARSNSTNDPIFLADGNKQNGTNWNMQRGVRGPRRGSSGGLVGDTSDDGVVSNFVNRDEEINLDNGVYAAFRIKLTTYTQSYFCFGLSKDSSVTGPSGVSALRGNNLVRFYFRGQTFDHTNIGTNVTRTYEVRSDDGITARIYGDGVQLGSITASPTTGVDNLANVSQFASDGDNETFNGIVMEGNETDEEAAFIRTCLGRSV